MKKRPRLIPPKGRDLDLHGSRGGQQGGQGESRGDARPVSGRVLSPRIGKPIAMVLVAGSIFAGLAWLLAQVWEYDSIGLISGRILGYMLLAGCFALFGAVATIYVAIRWRRLVIGRDRLQLLSATGRVIGQIPYSNISLLEVGLYIAMETDRVAIVLRKRKHSGTWWPGMRRLGEEYDLVIKGNYEVDATHLRMLLRDAMRKAGHGGAT